MEHILNNNWYHEDIKNELLVEKLPDGSNGSILIRIKRKDLTTLHRFSKDTRYYYGAVRPMMIVSNVMDVVPLTLKDLTFKDGLPYWNVCNNPQAYLQTLADITPELSNKPLYSDLGLYVAGEPLALKSTSEPLIKLTEHPVDFTTINSPLIEEQINVIRKWNYNGNTLHITSNNNSLDITELGETQ